MGEGELVLEVWDQDFFSDGEFMGEARLPLDVVLHSDGNSIEMPLSNRPGEGIGKITAGSITFKLIRQVKPQMAACPPRQYVKIDGSSVAEAPISIVAIKDPVEEARRQKYDK